MNEDVREIKLDDPPRADYKEGEYAGSPGEGVSGNLWDFDSMVTYAASSYRKGQRDLIEAMGEPVAWVAVHKNFTGSTTSKHNADGWMRDKSGDVFPAYRLPEGTPK